VREGLATGALASDAAAMFASTLPDLIDEDAVLDLGERGVPTIAGLRTAIACAVALTRPAGNAHRLRAIAEAAETAASGSDWAGEAEAKRLVAAAGIAVPEGDEAADLAGCLQLAAQIGWPVALKLSGPSIQHKAAVGALALGLSDEAALSDAFGRLSSLPEAATAGASYLVESMAPVGAEMIVAARADGAVPVVVLGLGGVLAEALDDVAIVPLPADARRIADALSSLRGANVLAREPGGVEAVSALAARTGELLLDSALTLVELNPVSVADGRAVALDAVIRR
jgi:acyl-CoA synthetase (NDP forming)